MNTSKIIFAIFTVAIIIQSFHFVEHLAQFNQHFFQGLSIVESNGLIDSLNVEWVHWVYNLSYFGLLLFLFQKLKVRKLQDKTNGHKVFALVFGLSVILQGYHLLEHSVRMIQWTTTDCISCSGITGSFVDGIALHFIINFLVFVYPLAFYIKLAISKKEKREVVLN